MWIRKCPRHVLVKQKPFNRFWFFNRCQEWGSNSNCTLRAYRFMVHLLAPKNINSGMDQNNNIHRGHLLSPNVYQSLFNSSDRITAIPDLTCLLSEGMSTWQGQFIYTCLPASFFQFPAGSHSWSWGVDNANNCIEPECCVFCCPNTVLGLLYLLLIKHSWL